MSSGNILTTHWMDLVASTQPTGSLTPALPWMPVDELAAGEKLTVNTKRQMIVHGTFRNDGTLIINGRLVIL